MHTSSTNLAAAISTSSAGTTTSILHKRDLSTQQLPCPRNINTLHPRTIPLREKGCLCPSPTKPKTTTLNLEVVRCSLSGTVVRSAPRAYNGCTSSSELDAQNVQPHQKTIKRKKTTPGKRVPAWMVVQATCLFLTSKAWAAAEKKEVSGCSERLHSGRNAVLKGSKGTTGAAGRPENGAKPKGRLLPFT